ncbi:MAG: aspartate kinase [Nitrososphaerota archaeon]|nr:aspartate kinase [Nitrososphaerota archaeon]
MSEKQHKTYVMKFGGSSLAGSKQILQSATLVKKYAADSNLVVVCSAMGDTTDHLLKAIDHAKKGETNQARKVISEVHVSHMAAVNESITEGKYKEICRDLLTELFDEIDKVLLGISLLKDLSPRSLDYVLSFGERLATNIMSNVLAGMGLKTRYLSGGEAGILTDESFGSAEPILSVTNEKLRSKLFPLISDGVIPVVTGYIAETLESHEIITLGRGGSDYTATLIAAAIDADEIILWTDVDGILSADPRIIKDAKILEQITYLEAMEMSAFGAKSMQPRALEPVAKKGIAVRIRNTFNPDCLGTLIVSASKIANGARSGVKAVGSITNVGAITISGTSIVGSPGTAAKIFEILKDLGVPILMMSQSVSENNVSLVVRRDALHKVVRAFKRELLLEDPDSKVKTTSDGRAKFNFLDYEDDVTILAVLGRGMIGTPGIAGRVFSTVAMQGVNVRMIAQGSSEINISFVIKDKDRTKAVTALHEEFVLKDSH